MKALILGRDAEGLYQKRRWHDGVGDCKLRIDGGTEEELIADALAMSTAFGVTLTILPGALSEGQTA